MSIVEDDATAREILSGWLRQAGTYVTRASGSDYSIVAGTKGAIKDQKLAFRLCGGLSARKVCVWRSNRAQQFLRLEDIEPVQGVLTLMLEPDSIYSVSTTRGQKKGSFNSVPPAKAFPFPYYETFDHYPVAKWCGYLPYYKDQIQVQRTFDRRTGELNGSLSGSARSTLLPSVDSA